jgi:hypothetical protein
LLYNNATQTSATELNVNHIDNDGVDINIFIHLLGPNDVIVLQDLNNSANFQKFTITAALIEQTGYDQIPVSLLSSGGTGTTGFSNNHQVFLAIVAGGVVGASGATGTAGSSGSCCEPGTFLIEFPRGKRPCIPFWSSMTSMIYESTSSLFFLLEDIK